MESALTSDQERVEVTEGSGSEFLSLDTLVRHNYLRYDAEQSVIQSSHIVPALPVERDLYRGVCILTSTIYGLATEFVRSDKMVPIVLNVRFGLCNPVDTVIRIDATSELKISRNGKMPMYQLLRLQAVPLGKLRERRGV
ncbi:hypothetical protein CEUSTIGMA_g3104.t1 [Chlamydomonas eustigma]|uniref:Uncharacterized protein n=1 Tax=Chlamydomonas eustigma TaxID=1157962 RepID=A0A250WYS6_9CHLO|nr:hypothetical protein CEUSTIGMA_g3104.t1 [Chlamydomonas eustigma]|eukprot:GAX75660.1 hypothetical protein CEUSTIGMA_g3104.t1 [Chlamydomonas eustigma]